MYIVSPLPNKMQTRIIDLSEKPHILSVSEKPPLSTWGACKNRSQPQLKVSFKFVVPPDDKNCKWDEFWKDVSLRIDLRASKGVGIPKEKNLYDWMKLTKTPRRRISAFAVVLVNQQANARTMLWTESLNFFFGSKMSLNLGHFEPRVLWKWVARVVAWGVRVSAYFACTSHVLYMPTHLCPRVEGGSGVNRNIQRVHDASISISKSMSDFDFGMAHISSNTRYKFLRGCSKK